MNITIILPPTEQELSYSLTLEKLQFAGTDLTSINLSRDFQTDSRSPVVLNSSVENVAIYDALNMEDADGDGIEDFLVVQEALALHI